MLRVERLKVSRKTLIEPDIGPVMALHVIAEPLLAQLMVHQNRAGIVPVGALIVQRAIGQRSCTNVLLASEDEVLHRGLRVLLIRIFDAGRVRKNQSCRVLSEKTVGPWLHRQ